MTLEELAIVQHAADAAALGGAVGLALPGIAQEPVAAIAAWFAGLQSRLVAGLEDVGGDRFLRDAWQREPDSPTQGSGISCVLDDGKLFERAGVMFYGLFVNETIRREVGIYHEDIMIEPCGRVDIKTYRLKKRKAHPIA